VTDRTETPGPGLADHQARILIVDDEPHNRRLLEVMLTPEGFLLQTADTGEEALTCVAQQPPDLILLAVMMPGMDGYEVASMIKNESATKHIPIIMVTALGDREAIMRGLNAGVEDFLTKPVDRAELRVRVKNMLRLKAYGDYYNWFSQTLEAEVTSRTADLVERTRTLEHQAAVLTEHAALLDLAPNAIIVRDLEYRILFWNRGAEVMYGWPRAQALGEITFELLKTEFPEPIDSISKALLRDSQVQWMLSILAGATLIVAAYLVARDVLTPEAALRHGTFNVVSVMTGTGFASTDFGAWGGFAVVLMLILMFIGGCAGSTTCGIKIFRFQIVYAEARVQLRRLTQPNGVFIPYYNHRPIPDKVSQAVMGFFFVYTLSWAVLALGLGLMGLDFITAISGAATAISNVGPGLGPVIGPSGTFTSLPAEAKWLLSFGMLLGRLELFTVLVLFSPAFWRG
jgi:DNA-binding response OmpR family regulator